MGKRGYEGSTKITKETMHSSLELQGRLKEKNLQICRLPDLIQLCLRNKREEDVEWT